MSRFFITIPANKDNQANKQKWPFQLCFSKKYVEVMINDCTMHLIFRNGLEYKNADTRENNETKVEAKEKTVNAGAQSETVPGRGRFLELGHYDKDFVKKSRKEGPAGKNFSVFSPRYSSN